MKSLLDRNIDHAERRIKQLSDEYIGNEQKYTFHAGRDLGYWQGLHEGLLRIKDKEYENDEDKRIYTKLRDINDEKIFYNYSIVKFNLILEINTDNNIISSDNEIELIGVFDYNCVTMHNFEIIGNIFDNEELIKGI